MLPFDVMDAEVTTAGEARSPGRGGHRGGYQAGGRTCGPDPQRADVAHRTHGDSATEDHHSGPERSSPLRAVIPAVATGTVVAREGGSAVTGIKNSSGGSRQGPARAVHTGNAEATGAGSSAVTGIVNE